MPLAYKNAAEVDKAQKADLAANPGYYRDDAGTLLTPTYQGFDGLTAYRGPSVINEGNSSYLVNPTSGQRERAFQGGTGGHYLESDLIGKYGSLDAAQKAAVAAGASPFEWSNAQPSSNDPMDIVKTSLPLALPVIGAGLYPGLFAGGGGALSGLEAAGVSPGAVGAIEGGLSAGGSTALVGSGAAQAIGLDPTGLGAGNVAFNSSGQLGLAPSAAGAGTPAAASAAPSAAAGSSAPAGSAPAGAAATGTSFTDSLIAQMKQNALGLGLIGAGTLASVNQKTPIPNQQQIQGLGEQGAAVANQLIGNYRAGTLQPGQQASLDQLTQNTKNQLRQYFASSGQADSTAAVQAMAQVDQAAAAMKQQMLDTMLQQGLSAIGVSSGPLNTIAQYQLSQDQQLRQAFGNFATGVGTLFGRSAGTTSAKSPAGNVSSAQTPQVVQSTQQNPLQVGG